MQSARLGDILVWLVLHFITFERLLPGVQTWSGRKRATNPLIGKAGSAAQSGYQRPRSQLARQNVS